jgi:hypothetical protein
MDVLGASALPLFEVQKRADIWRDAASHGFHVAKTDN